MVKNNTAANVPIIDPGLFGEKLCAVSMVIIRKYIFAARVNWKSRDKGAHVSIVYLYKII